MNDTDIFGDPGKSAPPVGDADIFKDLPTEQKSAPVQAQAPRRDLNIYQRRMGLGHQGNTGPLDTLRAADAALTEFGGSVADLAARAGAPPAVAAGLGVAANIWPQLIGGLPGRGAKALTAAEEAANALAAQRASILAKGRDAGFVVPPTQVNPSYVNRAVEGIGGKAATAQEMAVRNENAAYAIAQREAGLSPSQSINEENLRAARDAMSAPHKSIAELPSAGVFGQAPFKTPGETLKDIQNIRKDVKDKWYEYQRQGKASVRDEAVALSAKADQLEMQLEQQVAAAGKPELAQAYRDARVALAKNFTVERAMRGSSFDPAALARLESRKNVPLSGDLETVMQMYRDFPRAMSAPQVGGSPGVHQLMPFFGGGLGSIVGAMTGHGAAEGGIAGFIAGNTIPPLARNLMISKAYQEALGQIPKISPKISGQPALLSPAVARLLAEITQPPALDPYASGALYSPPSRGAPEGRTGGGSR